jgi:phage host-nuclease inhibitor protein Gam
MLVSYNFAYARGKGKGFWGCDELSYGGPYCRNFESFKNFRKETIDLREKLSKKRFELEKELLSDNPDKQKIGQIEKEIEALWGELQKFREKHREELGQIGLYRKDGFKWGGPYDSKGIKKFSLTIKEMRRETLDLRHKLSEKKFLLEKELLSENPDKSKVDNLKKEIDELSKELEKIREEHRAKKLR